MLADLTIDLLLELSRADVSIVTVLGCVCAQLNMAMKKVRQSLNSKMTITFANGLDVGKDEFPREGITRGAWRVIIPMVERCVHGNVCASTIGKDVRSFYLPIVYGLLIGKCVVKDILGDYTIVKTVYIRHAISSRIQFIRYIKTRCDTVISINVRYVTTDIKSDHGPLAYETMAIYRENDRTKIECGSFSGTLNEKMTEFTDEMLAEMITRYVGHLVRPVPERKIISDILKGVPLGALNTLCNGPYGYRHSSWRDNCP